MSKGRVLMQETEFEQVVAEAVHRIGQPLVEAFLIEAAGQVGWPIPPERRLRVGALLALMVRAVEDES